MFMNMVCFLFSGGDASFGLLQLRHFYNTYCSCRGFRPRDPTLLCEDLTEVFADSSAKFTISTFIFWSIYYTAVLRAIEARLVGESDNLGDGSGRLGGRWPLISPQKQGNKTQSERDEISDRPGVAGAVLQTVLLPQRQHYVIMS